MKVMWFRFTGTDGAVTRSAMPAWFQRIRFAESGESSRTGRGLFKRSISKNQRSWF